MRQYLVTLEDGSTVDLSQLPESVPTAQALPANAGQVFLSVDSTSNEGQWGAPTLNTTGDLTVQGQLSSPSTSFASAYREAVVADKPVSYWRLGEKGQSTVAYDQMGANNGTYIGSQKPNLVGSPLTNSSLTNWSTAADAFSDGYLNAGATLTSSTAVTAEFGTAVGEVVTTTAAASEGIVYDSGQTYPPGTYTLSLYLMGSAGGETLDLELGPNVSGVGAVTVGVTLTTGWQRFTATLTTTVTQKLPVAVQTQTASADTFYVNAVQVTETSAAVPYSDTQGVVLGSPGALSNDPDPAVKFDGQNGQITLPSLTSAQAFTAEAWINLTTNGNNVNKSLIAFGDVQFFLNWSGYLTVFATTASAAYTDSSSTVPPLNQWSHAAVTYDGTDMRFYLNGSLLSTVAAASSNFPTTSATGNIGASLPGRVDEAALYDYTLTPAQIAAHYAAGANERIAGSLTVQDNLTVDGSLTVQDNATVDGSLTVDGAGAFTGTLTAAGQSVLTAGTRSIYTQLGAGAATSVATAAWTVLALPTTMIAQNGGFAFDSSNANEIVVPTAGLYVAFTTAVFNTGTSGYLSVSITQNGSLTTTQAIPPSGTANIAVAQSLLFVCAAGDTLGVQAYQNSGATMSSVTLQALNLVRIGPQ